MDRQTRKANLKKLRLSGIKHIGESLSGSLRTTRSANGLLSKYFKTATTNEVNTGQDVQIESSCSITANLVNAEVDKLQTKNKHIVTQSVNTRGRKRTKLQNFILTEETNVYNCFKNNSEDNVEVPIKKIKTRINVKRKNNSSNSKRSLSKGQSNIKTLLMRNELMFSEITSKQCRSDNFSADDIHLALALSKSQVEIGDISYCDGTDQRIENKEVDMENVLRQYGFRTVGSEVHNSLNAAFVPGFVRRGRNKWANKFTALTLRDAKLQAKKVQSKIDCLMMQEWNDKQVSLRKSHSESYSLISYNLKQLKPSNAKIFDNKNGTNVEEFYVKNLFDVNSVTAGYLLKNWHVLEGRELSPQGANRCQMKSNEIEECMNQSIVTLEKHFSMKKDLFSRFQTEKEPIPSCDTVSSDTLGSKAIRTDIEKYRKDDLEYYNDIESVKHTHVLLEQGTLSTKNIINIKQDDQTYNSMHTDIKQNLIHSSSSKSCSTMPKLARIQSPNIFASSDDELEEIDFLKTASNNQYELLNTSKEAISSSNDINKAENLNASRGISNIIDMIQELPSENHEERFYLKNAEERGKQCKKLLTHEHSDFEEKISINESCGRRSHLVTEINFLCNSSTNSENTEGLVERVLIGNMNSNSFSENTARRTIEDNSLNRRDLNTSTGSLELVTSNEKLNKNEEDSSEECIVLSDDEINYSMWRAELNSFSLESPSNLFNKVDGFDHKKYDNNALEFSIVDLVKDGDFRRNNCNLTTISNSTTFTRDGLVLQPCELSGTADRSAELLEYGILDNVSEQFTQSSEIINSPTNHSELNNSFSSKQLAPVGLDSLLNGKINVTKIKQKRNTIDPKSYITPLQQFEYLPDEYEIAGRIYTTRIITNPKPDFAHQSESEILKQLYEYGIKPLKRKQAVKLLEYIYNSTNPLILTDVSNCKKQSTQRHLISEQSEKNPPRSSNQIILQSNKLCFKDCFGTEIKFFKHELQHDLECEDYVFQKNITKKTPRPLLPLHIAWYNLVSSSIILNETILTYKPIDLQEIYAFFKQIGYRFEPKDLKAFLDKRCIIFRYDMSQPNRQAERHIHKYKKCTKR